MHAPALQMPQIDFIGTGNSFGIPAFGCECKVCRAAGINLERRRTPPCTVITTGESALILDAGDLSLSQTLTRYRAVGILVSHFHAGHIYGLLSLSTGESRALRIVGPPDHGDYPELRTRNPGVAYSDALPMRTIQLGEFSVTPVLLNHGPITYGFCIEIRGQKIGYLCDTCELPPQTQEYVANWEPDVLIIDCNQPPERPCPSHNTPHQAFQIHRDCRARRSFLYHISCATDRWLDGNIDQLPTGVEIARDGMVLHLTSQRAAEAKSV